jgi:hypothetical protein
MEIRYLHKTQFLYEVLILKYEKEGTIQVIKLIG